MKLKFQFGIFVLVYSVPLGPMAVNKQTNSIRPKRHPLYCITSGVFNVSTGPVMRFIGLPCSLLQWIKRKKWIKDVVLVAQTITVYYVDACSPSIHPKTIEANMPKFWTLSFTTYLKLVCRAINALNSRDLHKLGLNSGFVLRQIIQMNCRNFKSFPWLGVTSWQ